MQISRNNQLIIIWLYNMESCAAFRNYIVNDTTEQGDVVTIVRGVWCQFYQHLCIDMHKTGLTVMHMHPWLG